MSNKTFSLKIICFLFMFTSLNSLAETDRQGWYVGGSLGHMDVKAEKTGVFDLKDQSATFEVFGGINFTHWLGLEAQLANSSSNQASIPEYYDDFEFLYFSVLPKFTWPISDSFEVFAKAGPVLVIMEEEDAYRSSADWDYDDWDDDDWDWFFDSNDSSDRNYKDDWTDILFTINIGANVKLHNGLRLRFGVERIRGELDETHNIVTTSGNVDLNYRSVRGHVGLYYQF